MSNLPILLLKALEPWRNARVWQVAFSGGLDSTVLLHLLAHLRQIHSLPCLSAIHVHHGLQAVADAWPAHCQALCDALGVPLQVVHVQVQAGASLERAARDARYQVFTALIQAQEVLLTGQHRDDQAETFLFRLLRGAGVNGLAAMPYQRSVGEGELCRPLLNIPRVHLEIYAREHSLSWIEDPSNACTDFSRNYLRHKIFPLLTWRWPQAVASIARSASHCAETQGLLDEIARQDLQQAGSVSRFDWLGLPSLELAAITSLSPARQRNALRHWLSALGRLPDTDHWAGWNALRDARADAQPVWKLAEGQLHRAGGRIWWVAGDWLRQSIGPVQWDNLPLPLALPGNGQLQFLGQAPCGSVQARYRQGGEVMMVENRGHRDLKRLLNEQGLPLFARGRLPLLYVNEQLLAVANLPGLDCSSCGGWQLQWLPTKSDQGLS